jgi:hypothetical protein
MIAVTAITVLIFTVSITISLTVQDTEKGITYIYLIDIIKKEVLKGSFMIQIALIIVIQLCQGGVYHESIGISYFILCIFKLFILNFNIFKVELLLINTLKKERYWKLFKVFTFNILVAHFIASIFLAMLKINNDRNWYQTKIGLHRHPYWF